MIDQAWVSTFIPDSRIVHVYCLCLTQICPKSYQTDIIFTQSEVEDTSKIIRG